MTAKKRGNTLSRIICIIINILTNEREIKKRCSLSLLLTPLQKDEKSFFLAGNVKQQIEAILIANFFLPLFSLVIIILRSFLPLRSDFSVSAII